HQCLSATATRKGFNNELTLSDLELARELLGDHCFRAYVCYSKDGEPVSSSVDLILNNKWAIAWVMGSKTSHLSNGVTQQLLDFEFRDLSSAGLDGIDFCGANINSVSEAKSKWGGELVPYYTVRSPGIKEVFRASKE